VRVILILLALCMTLATGAQNLAYPTYPILTASPPLANYFVQFRCGDGSPLLSLNCYGGPLTDVDVMIWRKCDWGSNGVDHYQCSDDWVSTTNNTIYQSWSYSPWGPLVDANGDGGQRLRVDNYVASYDATHAAAGPTQYLVGLGCGGDGWLIVDLHYGINVNSFIGRPARLAISASPGGCPPMTAAWTQWLISIVGVPFRGMFKDIAQMTTLVSEHYDMPTWQSSVNMERFFYSPTSFGWWRWESWCNQSNGACLPDGANLEARCPQLGTPWNGARWASPTPDWHLRDCRHLTNIVPWTAKYSPASFGIALVGE
jgi:hypothetical protein